MNSSKLNFANIVEAVNHYDGKVVNDHGQGTRLLTVTGIGNLQKGEKKLPVVFCDSRYFSLNLLYLGEGNVPHVSRDSVGGVVELPDGLALEQGILNYNESQTTNLFTSSFLTDIHYLVEGKLVAQDLVSTEQVAEMQAKAQKAAEEWRKDYDARKQA